jgi:hypothetical protein
VSLVTYTRFADAPPPERELLEVAASGDARAWRSIAPVGGRFEGRVPDPDRLRALVEAAVAAGSPEAPRLPPDAVAETLDAGGKRATLPLDNPPAGPWADLAAACRAALDTVSGHPLAAVGAAVAADGTLRLEHWGREPLTVELGSLTARTTLWRDGAVVWSASYGVPGGLVRTAVGPGWALELEPVEAVADGSGTLVAQVDLVADDAGVLVPLTLTAHVTR